LQVQFLLKRRTFFRLASALAAAHEALAHPRTTLVAVSSAKDTTRKTIDAPSPSATAKSQLIGHILPSDETSCARRCAITNARSAAHLCATCDGARHALRQQKHLAAMLRTAVDTQRRQTSTENRNIFAHNTLRTRFTRDCLRRSLPATTRVHGAVRLAAARRARFFAACTRHEKASPRRCLACSMSSCAGVNLIGTMQTVGDCVPRKFWRAQTGHEDPSLPRNLASAECRRAERMSG
jgi:hypothetical protein